MYITAAKPRQSKLWEWVMSRVRTSHMQIVHVTHLNEPCHTYKCAMSHVWMSHVTHTWCSVKIFEIVLHRRVHTHTHKHTCTHTHTHTPTHTHTHTHTYTYTHTHINQPSSQTEKQSWLYLISTLSLIYKSGAETRCELCHVYVVKIFESKHLWLWKYARTYVRELSHVWGVVTRVYLCSSNSRRGCRTCSSNAYGVTH